MTDDNTIHNRTTSGGPPDKPAKAGPFRVVQQALSALAARIDELSRDVAGLRTSSNSRNARTDMLEAKLRGIAKPKAVSAERAMVLEIGPPVVSANGTTTRELKFGDVTFKVLVDEPGGTQ
jgi:hypothetical protein